MGQKELDKTKKILEKHYSLHEADVLLDMICDEKDSVEEVENYMHFCDLFSNKDYETSYDNFLEWKKNMREEIVQDITLEAAYMLAGREYDSREMLSKCRELADQFESIYPYASDGYLETVIKFTANRKEDIESIIIR